MKACASSGFGAPVGMQRQSELIKRAFLRHHEIERIAAFGRHQLRHVAVVFEHDVDLAGRQQILAVVLVERLHVRLLADEHLLDLSERSHPECC